MLKVDPWFGVREEVGVADYGEREWAWGLFLSVSLELSLIYGGMVVDFPF